MSCGVVHRSGLDLMFLWLWCRPAGVAPIWPLAWEPPYATGAALKSKSKKKKVQGKVRWKTRRQKVTRREGRNRKHHGVWTSLVWTWTRRQIFGGLSELSNLLEAVTKAKCSLALFYLRYMHYSNLSQNNYLYLFLCTTWKQNSI